MHHDTNEYALQFDVICLFWLGNYINSIHSCSNIHSTNKLHSPDETAVALSADAASSEECNYRSVPQIRPPFCNLSLSRKRKGGLIRGIQHFLSRLRPPFQCPAHISSSSTERGLPQQRRQHFPSAPQVCPFSRLYF